MFFKKEISSKQQLDFLTKKFNDQINSDIKDYSQKLSDRFCELEKLDTLDDGYRKELLEKSLRDSIKFFSTQRDAMIISQKYLNGFVKELETYID